MNKLFYIDSAPNRVERLIAVAKEIKKGMVDSSNTPVDIILLTELWFEDDHTTIRNHLPDNYFMTQYHELADDDGLFGRCRGGSYPGG